LLKRDKWPQPTGNNQLIFVVMDPHSLHSPFNFWFDAGSALPATRFFSHINFQMVPKQLSRISTCIQHNKRQTEIREGVRRNVCNFVVYGSGLQGSFKYSKVGAELVRCRMKLLLCFPGNIPPLLPQKSNAFFSRVASVLQLPSKWIKFGVIYGVNSHPFGTVLKLLKLISKCEILEHPNYQHCLSTFTTQTAVALPPHSARHRRLTAPGTQFRFPAWVTVCVESARIYSGCSGLLPQSERHAG